MSSLFTSNSHIHYNNLCLPHQRRVSHKGEYCCNRYSLQQFLSALCDIPTSMDRYSNKLLVLCLGRGKLLGLCHCYKIVVSLSVYRLITWKTGSFGCFINIPPLGYLLAYADTPFAQADFPINAFHR